MPEKVPFYMQTFAMQEAYAMLRGITTLSANLHLGYRLYIPLFYKLKLSNFWFYNADEWLDSLI
jgi:hypothetical protein